MKKVLLTCLVLMAVAGFFTLEVLAGSTSNSLLVSATVTSSCTVNTADGAVFGNYVSGQAAPATPNDVTVIVACGSLTSFGLNFGQGSSWSATVGWRMKGPGASDYLDYDIELDTCLTASGNPMVAGSDYGTSAIAYTFQGCAKLGGGQLVNPGSYNDDILVSISW